MKSLTLKLIVLTASVALTACSTNFLSSQSSTQKRYADSGQVGGSAENPVATGAAPGGSLSGKMDETDKSKMFHALDSAPGKATSWTNPNTGITYTVTPVKKVTLNGNPYCREYQTVAAKEEQKKEINGTACVGQDGQWHAV